MVTPTGYTALDLVGFTDKGPYSALENYVKNDLVHYSGSIWRCKIDDTTNVTPAENANWTVFVSERSSLVEASIAPIETSPATAAHAQGSQLFYNDTLYKAKTAIAIGDSLVVDTNIEAAPKVTTQLEAKANTADLGTAAAKNSTNAVTSGSADLVTSGGVYASEQDIYKAMGQMGAKNLLPNIANSGSYASSGTVTKNVNGSLTINGTFDAVTTVNIDYLNGLPDAVFDVTDLIGTDIAVTFLDTAVSGITLQVGYFNSQGARSSLAGDVSTKANIVFPADAVKSATYLRIASGTYNNVTVYPMIRLASDTDNTYQPYAKTNQELTFLVSRIKGMQLPIIDLGTSYTAELKADISSGKFEKAVVGGRLTINGHKYLLAHPDYWLKTGDTECTKHHMLVVPAGNLASGKMNNDNSTAGGYIGSGMKSGVNHDESANSALADVAAIIKADFGAANILTHREYFTNAVADGKPSAGAWYDSDIDLMNENMVYGTNIFLPHPDGSTVPNLYTIDKTQIKLFAERPDLITIRAHWWLRDVVSAAYFAHVSDNGNANCYSASRSYGVRPAFAIC